MARAAGFPEDVIAVMAETAEASRQARRDARPLGSQLDSAKAAVGKLKLKYESACTATKLASEREEEAEKALDEAESEVQRLKDLIAEEEEESERSGDEADAEGEEVDGNAGPVEAEEVDRAAADVAAAAAAEGRAVPPAMADAMGRLCTAARRLSRSRSGTARTYADAVGARHPATPTPVAREISPTVDLRSPVERATQPPPPQRRSRPRFDIDPGDVDMTEPEIRARRKAARAAFAGLPTAASGAPATVAEPATSPAGDAGVAPGAAPASG